MSSYGTHFCFVSCENDVRCMKSMELELKFGAEMKEEV